jgi:hypothetical protein
MGLNKLGYFSIWQLERSSWYTNVAYFRHYERKNILVLKVLNDFSDNELKYEATVSVSAD